MWIVRTLQELEQELMGVQNDLVELLNSPENVQRVDHLVEDIHCALMDYQVCAAPWRCSHYV